MVHGGSLHHSLHPMNHLKLFKFIELVFGLLGLGVWDTFGGGGE